VRAEYLLGYLYHEGWCVKQDNEKEKKLYQQAIEQGSAVAMTNLGWLYHHGKGVKQDYLKASQLYARASLQGVSTAARYFSNIFSKAWASILHRVKNNDETLTRLELNHFKLHDDQVYELC
jgi:TPR repeat protein